ncbi:HAD family hydrolase [Glaciecola sp. KUL10]|uniref:HAD family hydrolase n=1 Tax=Glaciecola sp. (strain KUL10) TaxID=2161813 RepID=UPI000D786975|nr:HAD family hydrolase [Glaciecola sp. KUL10]GBL04162.1 HAD superfamily hydrolase-like protein [Glaciecola sp. KUL10]
MINKQKVLGDFGFEFLGPICSEYFHQLNEVLKVNPDAHILFLAREGYFFNDVYSKLISHNLIAQNTYDYFLASRTFLFRICIADPSTWEFSLKHNFEGTLDRLLVARFGFTHHVALEIFTEDELAKEYSLPNDFEEITTLFSMKLAALSKAVAKSRSSYFDYIRSLSLPRDKKLILVDVGYSGTIQKLLTHLLGQSTHGLYFITTKAGDYNYHGKTATMECVFKDRVKMGDGYHMLDKSLFLEALLTSPNGQFVDIEKSSIPGAAQFIKFYGRHSYTQANFAELEMIFNGATDAVVSYLKNGVRFTLDEIEHLYKHYTTKSQFIPAAVRPLFDVDDAISGNGNVNPLNLFKV